MTRARFPMLAVRLHSKYAQAGYIAPARAFYYTDWFF